MAKNNSQERPQEIKKPKMVMLSTYFQSMVIAILVTGVSAFIGGWFVSVNVLNDARANVVHDISAVQEVASKKVAQ